MTNCEQCGGTGRIKTRADVNVPIEYAFNEIDCLECAAPKDRIHEWFELTYAQYLTIPRSVLQSMPDDWQEKFVALLKELDEAIDWRPQYPFQYWVGLRDVGNGRMVSITRDPLMDYQRGRRRVPHKAAG